MDAASVAVPTVEHARVGCRLLELGIDVLVEKPMAASLAEADELLSAASSSGRILQVGHLERFNPAIVAVMPILNRPLYFEVHRLGVFTPRSLDIDVVYDVMIHDLDILLALVDAPVVDIKAIGIPVLTDKVDIAHARLDFATGAVANVTASRVSTERVRKMRFFQQHEYISVDFTRQDALRVRVPSPGPQPKFDFRRFPPSGKSRSEPNCARSWNRVRTRRAPVVDGARAGARWRSPTRLWQASWSTAGASNWVAFAAPQANVHDPEDSSSEKCARPVVSPTDAPPRRLSSDLDARTLVPATCRNSSSIRTPRFLPISSWRCLATPSSFRATCRTPRSMPSENAHLCAADDPGFARGRPEGRARGQDSSKQIVAIQDLPDVLDPDVLTTGEVNLMTKPAVDRTDRPNAVARVRSRCSLCVILLILLAPKIFPYHPPTDAEIARTNHRSLYSFRTSIELPGQRPRAKDSGGEGRSACCGELAPPREVAALRAAPSSPSRSGGIASAPPKPSRRPAAPTEPHPAESPSSR